jgi:Mg2+ and Co2+ transporter CorA
MREAILSLAAARETGLLRTHEWKTSTYSSIRRRYSGMARVYLARSYTTTFFATIAALSDRKINPIELILQSVSAIEEAESKTRSCPLITKDTILIAS